MKGDSMTVCGNPTACAATRQYRDEMDLVGRFVAECCEVGHDLSEGASALFKRFQRLCEDAGECSKGNQPINQMRFGMALTERGFDGDKVGGRVIRYGLALVDGFVGLVK